jgi:hypothetical protein
VGQLTDTAAVFVGIDVSKGTLDACLVAAGLKPRGGSFANDAHGHAALIRWAGRQAAGAPLHFCP